MPSETTRDAFAEQSLTKLDGHVRKASHPATRRHGRAPVVVPRPLS
jgi:hypothetical protein